MTESPSASPPKWLVWMPALALLVTLIGAMLTGGGYIAKQDDHSRRIEALERREGEDREKRSEQIVDIRERTIRIEARLDALVPAARRTAP